MVTYRQLRVEGTLGDAYLACCQIGSLPEDNRVSIAHKTEYPSLTEDIKKIYSLQPKIESVEFLNAGGQVLRCMEWFPSWKLRNWDFGEHAYVVIQPYADIGSERAMPIDLISSLIRSLSTKVVLIGTHGDYKKIKSKKCINLIGKTSILDTFAIIRRAALFIGLEGLLSYVALSQKVRCIIYYGSEESIDSLKGNPWEVYVEEFKRL